MLINFTYLCTKKTIAFYSISKSISEAVHIVTYFFLKHGIISKALAFDLIEKTNIDSSERT